MQSSILVFPSKRDQWLVVVIWVAVGAMAAGIATLWSRAGFALFPLLMTLALVLSIALSLSVLYGTRYELEETRLVIRSGPFRWFVDVHSIESIRPTDDPASSPACSLDRLEIVRASGGAPILISPGDKEGFISALARRDPQLAVDGSSLVRRKL